MEKIKDWIIGILISIIIVLIIITGIVYLNQKPEKILKTAISNLNKNAQNIIRTINLNDKQEPYQLDGTLSFNTNMDLNGLEELKNYKLGFQAKIDQSQSLSLVKLNVLNNTSAFLSADVAYQDNHVYLKMPDLLEPTIDLLTIENLDIKTPTFTNQNLINVLNFFENALLKTITKDQLTINKNVDKIYNGKQTKATEIIYTLNNETINSIINNLKQDENTQNDLAQILNCSKEQLQTLISNNPNITDDIKLIITTEGFTKKIIQESLVINDNNISFTDYNKKQVININDAEFTINEFNKNTLKLTYKIDTLEGTIYINNKNENNQNNLSLTITALGTVNNEKVDFTIELTLASTFDNIKVEKINTANAKKWEEVSQSELQQFYLKLIQKIADSPISNILNNY